MMTNTTQISYDRVAQEYAQRIYGELAHKPFDRKMLDWLRERTTGKLCDLGCGPGQIARYLHDQGATVCGVDLSPGMVAEAQRLNPDIEFQQGNLLALDMLPAASLGGIAAFYCLIHIPREQMVAALQELKRVLQPDGLLLLTFHIGSEVRHLEEWWGTPVALDFLFFEREEMKAYLTTAGFELAEVIERDPYPEVEVATRRAYIFARKPH
jgi:SAM-dependent methyltransferase